MLNILVPEIILHGAGIMPVRRKVIAARMPQLVGMGDKRQPRHLARSRHDRANGPRGQRGFALRHKHIGGVGGETLEFPQQAQLRTPQGMC